MAYQSYLQEYMLIPPVTRVYTTACVVTTLAVHLDLVSPFQLYFNQNLIIRKYQLWRLLTTFLFFGNLGFNFFFNIIFTYKYCRMLEEGSFRQKTADFVVMFLFGGILMIICAFFVNLLFLGQAFTIMIVYVWSRRNRDVGMNFFGLINFRAPYLPWVLLGFSVVLGNAVGVDLVGVAAGHAYFFLEDVLPHRHPNARAANTRLLRAPRWLSKLLDGGDAEDAAYRPLPHAPPQPQPD